MMSRKLVDLHEFTLWRYDDNTVDIQCNREGDDTIEELAYLEACVLARTLGEEIHQAEEIFCIRAYDTGGATTQWRDERGTMSGLKRFMWLKRSLHQASYGSLVEMREPPAAVLKFFWALEYGLAKLATRLGRSTDEPKSRPVESVELAVSEPHQDLPPNVVPFRRR